MRKCILIALTIVFCLGLLQTSVSAIESVAPGDMYHPSAINENGQFVLYFRNVNNVANPIYVRDRTIGTTSTVALEGSDPAFSGDGRYIVFLKGTFVSQEEGYDPQYSFNPALFDRVTGTTTILDNSGNTKDITISSDGNIIAYTTGNSIYIYDRTTGIKSTLGNIQYYQVFSQLSLSKDGRYLAFDSSANYIVPNDTNSNQDIFVCDRVLNTFTRISVLSNGLQGNGASTRPIISDDGSHVVFSSYSSNFVPGDTNNVNDIFVHNRNTGEIKLVTATPSGTTGNSYSYNGSGNCISKDNRYVVFQSDASNLVDGDTNRHSDIFIRDLTTGKTKCIDYTEDGSYRPVISLDGKYILFFSYARLTSNDGTLYLYTQDFELPTTGVALSGNLGNNDWYKSDVTVTLTAVDNQGGSGVAETVYSFDNSNWHKYTAPFTVDNEGQQALYYKSIDNNDNQESVKETLIKIDKTKPIISMKAPDEGSQLSLYNPTSAEWTATDNVSGIAQGPVYTPGSLWNLITSGQRSFIIYAEDSAGNRTTCTLNLAWTIQ